MAGGSLHGSDAAFHGVASDSRSLPAAALFVALRGPNFDGHDFLPAAVAAGAAGALVEHAVDSPLPQVVVGDPLATLGHMAGQWRDRFRRPLVGLTGSNGKTTLKEMIRAILARRGSVLATAGNYNNHIGMPLTLCRLDPDRHDYAVIEMGANHPGEIAYLTAIARPDVAVLNNAAACHIEGFGSLSGVARAKGEIFQGLDAGGVAVINADDTFARYWRTLVECRRVIDFGLHADAAVRGVVLGPGLFRLHCDAGESEVRLQVPGEHNVSNALAAAAACRALDVPLEDITAGLGSFAGVSGRYERLRGPHRSTLINDSYNANPASLAAAMSTLTETPRWLVLGDMGELGEDSAAHHWTAGEQARSYGFERLFTLGQYSAEASAAFGAGARHFERIEELVVVLARALAEVGPAPTVLIKGSRSMRLERVVAALGERPDDGRGR